VKHLADSILPGIKGSCQVYDRDLHASVGKHEKAWESVKKDGNPEEKR
jgi:hypothetical protein